MGHNQLIFELAEGAYRSILDEMTLDREHACLRTTLPNRVWRRFDMLEHRALTSAGGFISLNYSTHIGDFTDFNRPIQTEDVYGPAEVWGVEINTGEKHLREETVQRAVYEMEIHIPGFVSMLEYIGEVHGDAGNLLYKDIFREEVESFLRM